jgi:hypothetical protein
MTVSPPGFADAAKHPRSHQPDAALTARRPKIEPEGYGFNSNASTKFRVNGF